MTWTVFPLMAAVTTGLWGFSVIAMYAVRYRTGMNMLTHLFFWSGMLVLMVFILGLWGSLNHPPMLTLGETRLWYSFFMADNLVYIGFAFLTLGLIFGALWGKEAWGHYWNWDP